MKGKYINTVIMMAALSGKKSRRIAGKKETIVSLKDHKIIWSKNGITETRRYSKSALALMDLL